MVLVTKTAATMARRPTKFKSTVSSSAARPIGLMNAAIGRVYLPLRGAQRAVIRATTWMQVQ